MRRWLCRIDVAILLLGLGSGEAAGVQADASSQRVALARADSALAALEAGDLRRARQLAEDAVELTPDDPRALIGLGRVHLAWPRIGRFKALELFRRAARQTLEDPEPHYWIGRTGVALLGDDGEAIARRGLERTLALDPLYQDAWQLWRRLYRGPEERARMVELLLPHSREIEVRGRIALLWLEGGEWGRADSLLAELEEEALDARWPAWRAECAYVAGRDEEGWAHYQRALALADRDTAGALWAQVASITRPDERAAFAILESEARQAFFQAFWAPRDPNVRTPENERIGEHFRRRAEARDRFRLQHPLSLFHYSREYRNQISRVSSAERERYVADQLGKGSRIAEALGSLRIRTAADPAMVAPEPGSAGPALEWPLDAEIGFSKPDFQAISPQITPLGYNLPDMISDRGLVFIRHGEPHRYDFLTLDAEEWAYESDPPLRLRFSGGPRMGTVGADGAPILPEMMSRSLSGAQARSWVVALTSDRSSLAAPLMFGFWFARFRARDDPARTELLIFPEPGLAASAVLWDGAGQQLARADAEPGGWLELEAVPLRALLALDVERNDSLGRVRSVVELPAFGTDTLAVSDVLVAQAVVPVDGVREEVAAHVLPSLRLREGLPFVIYMEVYGLEAEDGLHHFEVVYEFERERSWLMRLLGGRDWVELHLERTRKESEQGVVPELTRISPGEIESGHYVLRIRVRDLASGRLSTRRSVSLDVGR
jgi:tetratricopeptide (TPR) repeat protein